MNITKQLKAQDLFFIVILVVAVLLPLVSLVKVSQMSNSSIDVFPLEVGGTTAYMQATKTSLNVGEETTINIMVDGDETVRLRSFGFYVMVPKALELVAGSTTNEVVGATMLTDFGERQSLYDSAYNESYYLALYAASSTKVPPSINITNPVKFQSFKVKVPAGTPAGAYKLKFTPIKSGNNNGADQIIAHQVEANNYVNIINLLNLNNLPELTLNVVAANQNPTVSNLTTTKDSYTKGEAISASVTATDPDGDALTVEFKFNNESTVYTGVRQGSTNIYTVSIPTTSRNAGSYVVSVSAKDANNGVSQSITKSVQITDPVSNNTPPTVNITAPTAKVNGGASITITASYIDDKSVNSALVRITNSSNQVVFTDTKTITSTSPTGSVSFTASDIPGGTYTILVEVTDAENAKGSTTRSLIVNSLPISNITSPVAGFSTVAPASVKLVSSATDSDGTISKVEFYRVQSGNLTKLGEDSTNPYEYTMSNLAAGTYTVRSIATDNDNARQVNISDVTFVVTTPVNTWKDARNLNLSIKLEGRENNGTLSASGHASEKVYVALFNNNALVKSAVTSTTKSGTLSSVLNNFFEGNGTAFELTTSSVIYIKPVGYLSQRVLIGENNKVSMANNTVTVVNSSSFLAGDPLADVGDNKYNIAGQNLVLGSDFDSVTSLDYLYYKYYLAGCITRSASLTNLIDYNGNGTVTGADYAFYRNNLTKSGILLEQMSVFNNAKSQLNSNSTTNLTLGAECK